MADNIINCDNKDAFKEAVCIDAQRVYDSCSDKDCIEDLKVYFTSLNQEKINCASSLRIKEASVISTYVNLEPVPFNRGFYSVDMTFYFDICLEAVTTPLSVPDTLHGISVFNKKLILYGSEGSVKVFTSGESPEDINVSGNISSPKAVVQVAKPLALSAELIEGRKKFGSECLHMVPEKVCSCIGGALELENCSKSVYVTLGLFIIVQLVRNAQMLIPAYDFCIPDKECATSSDSPCELFKQIDFPVNEFFPRGIDNKCME